MPDPLKPSAKEQRIVDLRQKVKSGVSTDNLPSILEEIVDILYVLQSEDELLKRNKQEKVESTDSGTA